VTFGGTLYQLVLAALIGIVSAFRSDDANAQPRHLQAATLGAKASFIFGTAFMLFSETRWWPVMFSIAALVTWILSGWIVALLGYLLAVRLRRAQLQ
jgi:hypothetical protein